MPDLAITSLTPYRYAICRGLELGGFPSTQQVQESTQQMRATYAADARDATITTQG